MPHWMPRKMIPVDFCYLKGVQRGTIRASLLIIPAYFPDFLALLPPVWMDAAVLYRFGFCYLMLQPVVYLTKVRYLF